MTKKLSVLAVFAAVIILLIWWLFFKSSPQSGQIQTQNSSNTNPSATASPNLDSQKGPNDPTLASSPAEILAWKLKRLKQIHTAQEEAQEEWRTPIIFYGKVEDQDSNGVPGAQIDFSCNDLSAEGTSFYHTNSDLNGFFTIVGIQGKLLSLTIHKDGYYTSKKDNGVFEYGDKYNHFTPDLANPVIFHLRKIDHRENLIHFQKSFRLQRDGTALEVDLTSGNISSSGENSLQVQNWTYDNQKTGAKYDWKCNLSIPNGGLQPYSEEFPFLAPDSGYSPTDKIDMSVTNKPWGYIVHRNYYIRTADGKFGRIAFTMVAGGDNFCEITSDFNPSGSRVLE